MTVEIKKNGTELTVVAEGKLDSMTSPGFLEKLLEHMEGVKTLVLDFEKLEYISSAGLRVLVNVAHRLGEDGQLVIKNLNDAVRNVFEITGLADGFDVE